MIAINRQLDPDNDDDDAPSETILNWCRQLVATIADGGVWGIPRSQIVFRLDHKKKQLVLIVGSASAPDFIATKKVFKHIGWDVVAGENVSE